MENYYGRNNKKRRHFRGSVVPIFFRKSLRHVKANGIIYLSQSFHG